MLPGPGQCYIAQEIVTNYTCILVTFMPRHMVGDINIGKKTAQPDKVKVLRECRKCKAEKLTSKMVSS